MRPRVVLLTASLLVGALTAIVAAVPVAGQAATGYVKNLGLSGRSVFTDQSYWLDITRGRVQVSRAHGAWRLEAWGDVQLSVGSFFETPEAAFVDQGPSQWADLDVQLGEGDRYRAEARLFRATATWEGSRTRVVAGRQRVAWGSGFVWNPTDLLNPLPPTSVERDEKDAVDALSASIGVGNFGGVDLVASVGEGGPTKDASRSLAARYRGHLGEYDVALMAGRFRGRYAIGGEFAGYLRNAGFRGEVAGVEDMDGRLKARAVANLDYTLASGAYGLVEFHYNGPGVDDPARYFEVESALSGGGLGRWYAAVIGSYPVTPLMGAGAYVIANMSDGSGLLGPSISLSVRENLDVSLAAYRFFGPSRSEFGSLGTVRFLTLQFYF